MAKVRHFEFTGSFVWLAVWLIVFFPVALIYFVLKLAIVDADVDDAAAALNNIRNRRLSYRWWKLPS